MMVDIMRLFFLNVEGGYSEIVLWPVTGLCLKSRAERDMKCLDIVMFLEFIIEEFFCFWEHW